MLFSHGGGIDSVGLILKALSMNKLCSLATVLVIMVEEWQCGYDSHEYFQ